MTWPVPPGLPTLLDIDQKPISPRPDAWHSGVIVIPRTLTLADLNLRPAVVPTTVSTFDVEPETQKPKPPPASAPWACPECMAANWDSAVVIRDQYTSTAVATSFYDQDNNYHVHDPNLRTTWYVCTRGHYWFMQENLACPEASCVWPVVD